MTRQEYHAYEERVRQFHKQECLMTFSAADPEAEPYFSWRACDCCGSHLGGNRQDYIGRNRATSEIQGPYSICEDCVYYNEYGRLDDATILGIE